MPIHITKSHTTTATRRLRSQPYQMGCENEEMAFEAARCENEEMAFEAVRCEDEEMTFGVTLVYMVYLDVYV